MPKNMFTVDYSPGDSVKDQFIVKSKTLKSARNGEKYIIMTLGDKKGTLSGYFWSATDADFKNLKEGEVYEIIGTADSYNQQMKIDVTHFILLGEEDVRPDDFIEKSDVSIEEREKILQNILDSITETDYKRFLDELFSGEVRERFLQSPAAKMIHHAYIGGLSMHTFSMVESGEFIAKKYSLNRDLLISGILIHDIGKIFELSAFKTIEYTTKGKLLGHITLGVSLVYETGKRVGLAKEKIDLLAHIILSHHTIPEFGSPKPPMIPEAFALTYIDDLDAKMDQLQNLSADIRDDGWTPWVRSLERGIFFGNSEKEDDEENMSSAGNESSENKNVNLEKENSEDRISKKERKSPEVDSLFGE